MQNFDVKNSIVLITGASGFIGKALCQKLVFDGRAVKCAVRKELTAGNFPEGTESVTVDAIGPDTNWESAISGVDSIVHLAARVHVIDEKSFNPIKDYRNINVAGTERLAEMAVQKKVRRFIYVSTVKVNGEGKASAYSEQDKPNPSDPYGISKWEAEQLLQKIGRDSDLEIVILRPPLVYGPGVKANFLQLIETIDKGIPLPLANVKNRRSLIFLENLVDIIIACISNPEAAGQTFLVSDGQDISTPDLIRKLASALGKSPRLFSLPTVVLRRLAGLIGKTETANRLLDSLCVDISKIQKLLNWTPPYTLEEGLNETARWYLGEFR